MATNEDGLVRLWKWNRDTLQFMDPESPITFACKFRARDKLRCSSFNYTGTKFTVAGDDGFVYVFSTIKNGPSEHGRATRSTNKSSTMQEGRKRRRVPSALFPDKNAQDQLQPIEPIAILEGHMGSVTDLAFSHDGQRILSG
jgi:WD40 repeat protein